MKPLRLNVKRYYQNGKIRVLFGIILFGVLVRSLSYLAPIRAQDIIQDQQALEFRDRHGLPLGTLLTRDQEHTAVVPLTQVSPDFLNAIIAAEDKRYYQHGALDGKAIARAILEAIQAQQIVSGASTITMQLARMLEPAPRTLPHKFGEIWLSWRLFAGMNKNEILHAYINRLPMGGNIYGVEAAARNYFGVPASDLTLAQASLLAAIPNDPSNLNPYHHWEALKRRQRYVLDRLVADHYITPRQADQANQEKIYLQPPQQGIIAAPHFLFWVASQVSSQSEVSTPINTTLDLSLQRFVETQIHQVLQSLSKNNVHQASALVIDNRTGEILAYVGSPDYFDTTNQGQNDGVQALRQPGSTLKPFLYQLALEKGIIRPNTILPDVPTHYAIPGAKLYSPTDYSETFLGPVRVRVALANSLNIPAVRVLEKVGVPNFLSYLQKQGFTHLNHPPEYYGLGLTLGSGEVSLWELARAYLTIARQGNAIDLKVVKTQKIAPKNQTQVDKTTSLLITNMLSDAHARAAAFGVNSVLNLPFPAAVKTGTSSDYRDTWTVGFTTDYTVATWVGNFNGEPMRQVSGVTGAAPLWNRIMLHLHEHQEPKDFPPPPKLVQLPICAISGMRPSPDCPAATVLEYFYPEDIASYRNSQDRFTLGAEYNEWLAKQQQPILQPNTVKITFPQPDDYFLVEPGKTARLEFKVAGTEEPIEWWLNGKRIASQMSESLFWSLTPGEWILEVKSGAQVDSVKFQVQVMDKVKLKRGFSVAKPEESTTP